MYYVYVIAARQGYAGWCWQQNFAEETSTFRVPMYSCLTDGPSTASIAYP